MFLILHKQFQLFFKKKKKNHFAIVMSEDVTLERMLMTNIKIIRVKHLIHGRNNVRNKDRLFDFLFDRWIQ